MPRWRIQVMIVVKVIPHSFLAELLPSATKGAIALELPDGARMCDVMEELSIPKSVIIALNEQIERDRGKIHQRWRRATIPKAWCRGLAHSSVAFLSRAAEPWAHFGLELQLVSRNSEIS